MPTAVKGTVTATRGAGPATGYTYTGDQTVSVAVVEGDLIVTVNHPVTYSGDVVSFHSSVTGGIPAAYWGITEWKWIPDVGSPSVVCVNYGPTCTCGPSGSGTMQTTANVNGAVRTATTRVVIQCQISGAVADSAFLRIANDTMTRLLGKQVWDSSGATGPIADRRERIGYWGVDSLGSRKLLFKSPTDFLDTPCSSWWTPNGINTASEWVQHHSHPFASRDSLPRSCLRGDVALDPTAYSRYDATEYGGPSMADFLQLSGWNAWGVIFDVNNVYVYHSPPDLTAALAVHNVIQVSNGDTVVVRSDTSVTLNNWQQNVRSYPRHQTSCSIY